MKNLIVTSASSEINMTQASVVYVASILKSRGIEFEIMDLSGMVDYFDPPDEFFSDQTSNKWLNGDIFYDSWEFDSKFVGINEDVSSIYYSALFSTDILVHSRHSVLSKEKNPGVKTVIGGAALKSLSNKAVDVLESIFDYVITGYITLSDTPNYSTVTVKPFVSVYSGQGCIYGKCRFCNSRSLSSIYYLRDVDDIVNEFSELKEYNVSDVMLTSDMFPYNYIMDLSSKLVDRKIDMPYNIMLRSEDWIGEKIAACLKHSGCTDVFIGAEAFDDGILGIVNKGTTVVQNIESIKQLHNSGIKVEIGLILFIPMVTENQLSNQIKNLELVLPYVDNINLEILTVLNGSEFADHPGKYGIELWPVDSKSIVPSWCYGFSPDIPWTFVDKSKIGLWIDHYKQLKPLLGDKVLIYYYESLDYLCDEFRR